MMTFYTALRLIQRYYSSLDSYSFGTQIPKLGMKNYYGLPIEAVLGYDPSK